METTDSNIGGYNLRNMADSAIFVSDKKTIKMSYRIHDIDFVGDTEIMKLKLSNGSICRIMKFLDPKSKQPSLMFDVVDDIKKEIISKSPQIYYNGIGLSGTLVDNQLIGQWEIVPTDKISRAFLYGDKNTLLDSLEEFNIKLSKSADWHIRNEME